MGEEALVACAEVVQPCFAVRRLEEAILGAPAMAQGQYLADLAMTRQEIRFGLPEGPLGRALKQQGERGLPDIAQAMSFVNEVIAGEKVPVVFDDGDIAAGLPEDAQRMLLPQGCPGRLFKDLNLDPANVLAQPLVKNGAEKSAEGFGRHGPVAYAAPAI